MKHAFTVQGMHCSGCKLLITDALSDAGATHVEITLDPAKQRGSVKLESPLTHTQLQKIIEAEGDYTVV